MDYRSPFELRQQLLGEARVAVAQPTFCKKGKSKDSNADINVGAVMGGTPPSTTGSLASCFMPSTTLPDDPTTLVCEVPGTEKLKALSDALEHEEAVQRHMEEENLSLEESATYIMANGSTAQKISFLAHIRESLLGLSSKNVSKILGILLDSMWTQDPELQCRAPETLREFVGMLSSSTAGELFCVVETMLNVKMSSIRVAWGKLLVALIGCLNSEQLEKDMIPLALAKSQHALPQDQRELSCDLLGCICAFVRKEIVESSILPRAMALCHDTNVGVRQHMCQQLGTIARALGVESAKQKVAPNLFELLSDEERVVSRTAFLCLLDLVEFFGSQYREERLYPIIRSYVFNPPSEVTSLLVVEYGRLLDKIKGDIVTQEDTLLFASFFKAAVEKDDEEARLSCAFNFPAVAFSLPLSVFSTHLSPCLNRLACDNNVQLRRSMAAGLHELVPVLGKEAAIYLEKPFLILLKDLNKQVRKLLFQHITVLLDCFASQLSGPARDAFFASVADILLSIAPTSHTDWHLMDFIVNIIRQYARCFNESVIVENFIPLLLHYEKVGANIMKDRCARVVMFLIHHVPNPIAQVQLFSKLSSDFAHSSCCYHRQSYFRFVREAATLFSRRCVRERLLESSLELQRDSVASVRVALACSLVHLYKGLRLNSPGTLEEEFSNMFQRLLTDEDVDVRMAAHSSKEALAERKADQLINPIKAEEEDSIDRGREKSEQAMLDLAKEFDKAERRAKLRELLKNDRDKELLDVGMLNMNSRRGASLHLLSSPNAKRNAPAVGSKSFGGSTHTSSHMLPRLVRTRANAASASFKKKL